MNVFGKYTPGGHKLNLSLFWEDDTTDFDPVRYPRLVVSRIVSFGRLEDWYAGFDLFNGIQGFAQIAKEQVTDLQEKDFQFMCNALGLKKEETACYRSRQSRKRLFNS